MVIFLKLRFMTVIANKEFVSNQSKYFNLAFSKEGVVWRDNQMFPVTNESEYDEILEPDEDLYSAITMDELRKRTHEFIHKLFANESISITES